jgi:26S proteasome regulatory subunit N1
MLYFLVSAMYPRFLITLDEELKSLPTSVRVGQAVDVVGQAGRPRTITGFQTHTSPVRLGTLERAELGSDEYLSYASVLEGEAVFGILSGHCSNADNASSLFCIYRSSYSKKESRLRKGRLK